MAAYEVLLLNTAVPQIQAAQSGDTYVVPRDIAFNAGFNIVNNDATIYGVTVGRGAGAVSTNTAGGASALAANTTGDENAGFGHTALTATTTGSANAAFGSRVLRANTTGGFNTALGYATLISNTTGNYNVAVGATALQANTTASNSTAVGYQSLYTNNATVSAGSFVTGTSYVIRFVGTTDFTLIGAANNNIGTVFTATGAGTGTGTAIANGGVNNTALGFQALYSNTTASYNTAVGYQAGYSNTTGNGTNSYFGYQAGYGVTTGAVNTFIGYGAGASVTTGSKNTILGAYNGNQGSLDIRTSSNNIVLSDGDGNPRAYANSLGNWTFPGTNGSIFINGSGYTINPGAMVLGQYTGTRTYIQASAGGQVEIWDDGTNPIAVFQDDRNVTFNSSISVGGASPTTSGTGITFPATQSASSNANTLDDYEEGTWTPAVRGALTAGTYELATAEGSYVKIGKQVTLTCRVVFDVAITGGGTGYLQITGAPSFNNAAAAYGAVSQSGLDMTTNYTWLTASFINTSGTTILYLDENGDSVSSSDFPISGVSANNSIRFSITYIATA